MLLFWIVNSYCVIFEKNFNFCPVGLDVQSTYTPYYIGAKKISNNANSLESAQTSQVIVIYFSQLTILTNLPLKIRIYSSHQCYVKSTSENVIWKLVSCSTQVNIKFLLYLLICKVCVIWFFFFYTFIVYSKMERETREFHMENAL